MSQSLKNECNKNVAPYFGGDNLLPLISNTDLQSVHKLQYFQQNVSWAKNKKTKKQCNILDGSY